MGFIPGQGGKGEGEKEGKEGGGREAEGRRRILWLGFVPHKAKSKQFSPEGLDRRWWVGVGVSDIYLSW